MPRDESRENRSYEVRDNCIVIRGSPKFDDANFRWACKSLLDSEAKELIIDMGKTDYIASPEIGVLIEVSNMAREDHKRLVLKASHSILTVLKIMQLEEFFEMVETTPGGKA